MDNLQRIHFGEDSTSTPPVTTPSDSTTSTTTSQHDLADTLGFCKNNDDCILSTYCCSDFSCADPGICLHGNKLQMDTCDFNFECMSRCCVDGICTHFLNCYQKCASNVDCEGQVTPCCSQDYCTQAIVCEGNKSIGDTCSDSSECLTDYCDKAVGRCLIRVEDSVLEPVSRWILFAMITFTIIFSLYCCKGILARFTSIRGELSSEESQRDRRRSSSKNRAAKGPEHVTFYSESGQPLLFSFDENAYDDAAHLVDRTFERSFQF